MCVNAFSKLAEKVEKANGRETVCRKSANNGNGMEKGEEKAREKDEAK